MFQRQIGAGIPEISHKRIAQPSQSVYFNHIHNYCEMLLFISGEANYNIDGQIFKPAPYDLLFVPAGAYHYLIPTAPVSYENYVIGIQPDILDALHYRKLFSPPLMIRIPDDAELKGFFARLDFYDQHYSPQDFDRCAGALIQELITYCSYRKSELDSVRSASLTHIDEIISYISSHLEQPLDAQHIARHFLLSKSYVQNMFSNSMHIGLKKYIMQKKIYAAHDDLAQGISPGDVCEKYGFGDYSVFYRLYRKTFCVSPGNHN